MIKLRLWGEREEVNKLEELICNSGLVRVTSISEPYKDRGASVYERVYMDVVLIDDGAVDKPKTKLISRGAGHEES